MRALSVTFVLLIPFSFDLALSQTRKGADRDKRDRPDAAQAGRVDPRTAHRFEQYDTDGNGLISFDEFLVGPFSKGGDNRKALRDRFEEIDRNGDKNLDLAEYDGAKRIRDEERKMRGRRREPEEPGDPEPGPLLTVDGKNPDGSTKGTWRSELLGGKKIPCRIWYPRGPKGNLPVIVYLEGLPIRRIGKLDDETLIRQFLADGMMVVQPDYGLDRRAVAPELLPEIDRWYGYFSETDVFPVDTNWIYIIPAGHTIDRKVRIVDLPDLTVDMDVIYPSGSGSSVPLMLQISSIKDQGLWINQRAYYIYGMLTNGYAGAIMEHNGGTRFSPKGDLFPEKRAARLLRSEAGKYNLSGKIGVTGHSKGSSRAAKAAFLNDGEREGDPGPHAAHSDRFQVSLLSAGQHATEFLVEDGYLDEVGPDKRAAAEREFANTTLEEMLEISTTTYVTPDDPPAFLCVGELDKQFRVRQMNRLAEKCAEVGVEYRHVVQPDMPHQYIDDPVVIGRIFAFLDRYLK